MRAGDLQHVRAVLGQRASTCRPGEHTRQVQHADTRHRPIAGGQRLRRTVADPHDLQQGQAGDGGALRMLCPLGLRSHHSAGTLGGDDRFLEIGGVPVQHRLRHCVAVLGHPEHAQRGGAMVGEVAVQVAPAAILGGIHAHDGVAPVRHLAIAQLHVVAAAQRRGGLPHIDRNGLAAPGARFPQIRGRKPRCGQCRRTGHSDAERCRQNGIGAAGERHAVSACSGYAGNRQDRAQGLFRHGRGLPSEWQRGEEWRA